MQMIAHPLESEDPDGGEAESTDGKQGHRSAIIFFCGQDDREVFRRVKMPTGTELAEHELTSVLFGSKGAFHNQFFCTKINNPFTPDMQIDILLGGNMCNYMNRLFLYLKNG